jgi:DNA repair exonuclease SbcCD ATPase subunit
MKNLGLNQGKYETISRELASFKETKEACSAYEYYAEAMGKDGIALQILTEKLPELNEAINKILAQSVGFGVYIEYDQSEQSIRLYLKYGQYKQRLLELGSGAEKFLASIAIRSALIHVSNLPKTNMFIIDEGFGKLDPAHVESVQRMFDYLKSVFDHVLVISHSDLMKDLVDNTIDITTDENGYAHVDVSEWMASRI